MKPVKYTARRNIYDNVTLYRGPKAASVGWLPDAFAKDTEAVLLAAGFSKIRVVTLEGSCAHLLGSHGAWAALYYAANNYAKFTIIAR